jgi:hypothetical protein
MGNLGSILNEHAKRLGIEKQVEAVGVVEAATKEIEKYISREDFEVISFKAGALKIWAKSSVVAAEIMGFGENIKTNNIRRVQITNNRADNN